jgi:hypothetical protein
MQAKRYSSKYSGEASRRPSVPYREEGHRARHHDDHRQRAARRSLRAGPQSPGGIGDIWIALEQDGEYTLAERMGIEFGEDFCLLADLGWEPEDKRKSVELTMEPHDLAELLTRLRGEAEGVLDGTTCMCLQREEEEQARAIYQGAKDTCEELLARLDGERG